MRAFGAELDRGRDTISIAGGQRLKAIDAVVPGDLSSAAFFLCAALLFPDSQLVSGRCGHEPVTIGAARCAGAGMGLRVQVLNLEEKHGEMIGTLQVNGAAELKGAEITGTLPALIIDEIPVLAAIAPFTRDGMTIRNAKELRVKESDRIALVVQNLRAMGADVEEFEDGMHIPGGQTLRRRRRRFGRRSPHRHGIFHCSPARGGRDHHPRRGSRGRLFSGVLHAAGRDRRAVAALGREGASQHVSNALTRSEAHATVRRK